MKTISEIAGWGPLGGDVAFWKSELETAGAVPIPLPGVPGDSGISATAGLRAGMIYPLPLGMSSESKPSRVNDRFQLGGPTDVRGFKIAGLGPRDGPDAVGGDVYAAASANILFPFPRLGKESPLRFQLFANGGRLLALKGSGEKGGMSSKAVQKSIYRTIAELTNGLPSLAAGFGIVYAHPVARFELNFTLPLVMRKGEEGRKGLQFGVGINFL
jgi:outer membrane protein insertion porin family